MHLDPSDSPQPLDALEPDAALEALAALPLEARPEALLRLADELERLIDSAVAPVQSIPLERVRPQP